MSIELFQDLGLSPNEAKIYNALIIYGNSGVSTISLRANIHRRNAYDALQRLVEKALVYEVFVHRETLYEAVNPTKLIELLKEKEEKLNVALPSLMNSLHARKMPQRCYIYRGFEGVKNYLREALSIGEDIHSFAAKGAWFDPRIMTFTEWFLKEAKKKKMKYFHIFDHEVQKGFPQLLKFVGKPYKFLPPEFSTNSTLDIFGDHVVTFTGLKLRKLEDDLTINVMVSRELADGYRTWWKAYWDLLK